MNRRVARALAAAAAAWLGAAALAPAIAPAQTAAKGRSAPIAKRGASRTLYEQNGDLASIENVPYDGRFVFARIRFDPLSGGFGRRRDLKWDHDTPRAELHFMKILRELSTMRPFMAGGNIFTLDDPELFKYPVAYVSEPGFWTMTDAEAAGMRAYLRKGGFVIFDDFVGGGAWANFEQQMRTVLPQARLVQLDATHPIFDSFFHIPSLDFRHPYFGVQSLFFGIFEDNDPKRRLIAIVNFNNDIGEYWEWSDTGFLPIDISNEAYKLGVNYVMYALTH